MVKCLRACIRKGIAACTSTSMQKRNQCRQPIIRPQLQIVLRIRSAYRLSWKCCRTFEWFFGKKDHSNRTFFSQSASIWPHSSGYLWRQIYIKVPDVNTSDSSTQTKVTTGITDRDAFVVFFLSHHCKNNYWWKQSSSLSKWAKHQWIFLYWILMHKQGLITLPFLSSLTRHNNHRTGRNTDCAKMKFSQKLYEVNESRAGSLFFRL